MYKSTKEVLKDFRSNQEDKLQHHLTSQGFFSNVFKYSLSSVNSICSEAQSHLSKNIYNFTIRYVSNSLPTSKNMTRSMGISQSPNCSYCLNPESLPRRLYVLELMVGFESNLDNNAVCKKEKYLNLIKEMSRNYRCVKFVDLSMR